MQNYLVQNYLAQAERHTASGFDHVNDLLLTFKVGASRVKTDTFEIG